MCLETPQLFHESMRNYGEIGIDPLLRLFHAFIFIWKVLSLDGAWPGSVEMYYTISVGRQCDSDRVPKETALSIYISQFHYKYSSNPI